MKKYIDRLYFAYGSNLHLNQMKQRCPDSIPVEKAKLIGYQLTFRGDYLGGGVADIIPCEGDYILGALYKISVSDLVHLDNYEDYPTMYDRYDIEVMNESEKKIEAFVYRMNPEYKIAVPSDSYFQTILEGFENWNIQPEKLLTARSRVIETLQNKR